MIITTAKIREGDVSDLYNKLPASRAYIDAVASKVNEKSRQQSVAGLRALLFLSEKSGIDLTSLVLAREDNGKPYFENSGLQFGISHSGDRAVCALSDKPVGIDMEQVREIKNAEELAARFFAAAEKDYVSQAPDKSEAFLEVWTKKEAWLKKTGTGISVGLAKTDTDRLLCRTFHRTYDGNRYIISVACEEEISFIE